MTLWNNKWLIYAVDINFDSEKREIQTVYDYLFKNDILNKNAEQVISLNNLSKEDQALLNVKLGEINSLNQKSEASTITDAEKKTLEDLES